MSRGQTDKRPPFRTAALGVVALAVIGGLGALFLEDGAVPALDGERVASGPAEAEAADVVVDDAAAAPDTHVAPGPAGAAPALRRVFLEVTNEEGAAVRGAEVALVKLGGQDTVGSTDGAGVVELTLLRPTPVRVTALGYEARVFSAPAFGEAPEVFWSVKLVREAGTELTGLIHAGGAAVAKAVVLILAEPPEDSVVLLSSADGRFDVKSLPKQPKAVVALHGGYGEARTDLEEGAREVEVELPAPSYLEGTVVDAVGTPVDRFTIHLQPRGHRASPDVALVQGALEKTKGKKTEARWLSSTFVGAIRVTPEADEDLAPGAFRAGPIMAGQLDATASAPGLEPERRAGIEVGPGQTLRGLRFVLRGPTLITGVVTDGATGAPIAGARVRSTAHAGVAVPGFGEARTGPDGHYEMAIPAEKRQRLRVNARGYLDLEVGGIEGRRGDVIERNLTLSAGSGRHQAREYIGIGATVRKVDDGVMVLNTIEGGAAQKELAKGDVIVRVDQTWVDDLPLPEAIELLVGEAGTDVDVLVHRKGPDGQMQEVEVALRRARLRYTNN